MRAMQYILFHRRSQRKGGHRGREVTEEERSQRREATEEGREVTEEGRSQRKGGQ